MHARLDGAFLVAGRGSALIEKLLGVELAQSDVLERLSASDRFRWDSVPAFA